jgi:ATP-binding protein involved in chromosome partitioning
MSEEKISEVVARFRDPVLKNDFVSLRFIKNISLKGKSLSLVIGTSDTTNPALSNLKEEISNTLKAEFPNLDEVVIDFVSAVLEHKNQKKSAIMPGVKNTIAVASGKGGVGKSTVTVNLACALTSLGFKVGIIDADIYGPSVPLMMNLKGKPSVTKSDGKNKLVPMEQYGVEVMSIGFLMEEGTAVVWRGPMASSALKQFMSEVVWGNLDFILFDMPPGTGDIQLTLSQTLPLTGALIVTTPQEISLADARKGHIMFSKVNVPTLGIIENMSYYQKQDGSKDYIFGHGGGKKMSDEYNVNLLGEIPINTSIREYGDSGKPIVIADPASPEAESFIDIARKFVNEVNLKNNIADKIPSLEIEI